MSSQHRLLLYQWKENSVRLDRCALFFLREMHAFCEKILLVMRNAMDEKALLRMKQDGLMEDAVSLLSDHEASVGWNQVLRNIGWKELEQWDEVILASDDLMGPVFSPEEMFREMENREDIDFWGATGRGILTEENGLEEENGGRESVQADFIALRHRMIANPGFQEFVERGQQNRLDDQETGEDEFIQELEKAGFLWTIYARTPENGSYTRDFLRMAPVRAIREGGCPFFLRTSFTCPQMEYLASSAGEQPWELFQYIKENTEYDTDMLLESLIPVCHQDDLVRTLRMTYILPSAQRMGTGNRELRTALVMHLHYMDLLEESLHYAVSMPDDCDIWILTSDPKKAMQIRELFSCLGNRVEIRVTQNRGRDVGSFLVGAADLQERYDLICFYHDKKSNHVQPPLVGHSFAYKLAECALSSKAYVENVISLFEANPRIGMLTGITPNHAGFIQVMGDEWGANYEIAKGLAKELGFQVPMPKEHLPAIGLGDVFWYRTKAMVPLFRKQWRYEDFPEEPVGPDETILHAMERLYPFAVQEAEFLPGKVMPDHLAALEIDNLTFYTREYTKVRKQALIYGAFSEVLEEERIRLDPKLCDLARSANLPTQMRLAVKRKMPRKIYRGITKVKRALFGPHDVQEEDDEELDRKLAEEYELIRNHRT